MNGDVTNDEMIDGIKKATDELSGQLLLLSSLVDIEKIGEAVKQKSVLASIGMAKLTPQDEFAYVFIKLVRPEILEAPIGD